MRLAPLLLLLSVLAPLARGQGVASSDAFADPTPWPLQEVQVAPAPLLPTVARAATPEQLHSLLATATPEQLRSFLVGASAPQLTAFLALATPTDLLRAFGALAGRPEALTTLLAAADSRGMTTVIAALAQRTQALAVDPAAGVDLDVLEAVSRFASLDPRFRAIGNYSYFGRQLEAVRSRIAAGGMTPENRAAIVAIYRQATEALKAFQAAEQQEAGLDHQ